MIGHKIGLCLMRPCGGGILYQSLGIGGRVVGLTFLLIGQTISDGSLPTGIGLSVWSSSESGLRCLRSVVLGRGNKRSLLLWIFTGGG